MVYTHCKNKFYTAPCTLYFIVLANITNHALKFIAPDMKFVTNLHRQYFSIICLPEKHINYDILRFASKQCIMYILIVNHHQI